MASASCTKRVLGAHLQCSKGKRVLQMQSYCQALHGWGGSGQATACTVVSQEVTGRWLCAERSDMRPAEHVQSRSTMLLLL